MMFQIAPGKPELVRLAELAATATRRCRHRARSADGSAVPMKDGIAAAVRNQRSASSGRRWRGCPATARRRSCRWRRGSTRTARRPRQGRPARPDARAAAIAAALGGPAARAASATPQRRDVVLPMGATQDDFDRCWRSAPRIPSLRAAANGVPKWNGRALSQPSSRPGAGADHDDGTRRSMRSARRAAAATSRTSAARIICSTRALAQGLRGILMPSPTSPRRPTLDELAGQAPPSPAAARR
jgi:hypothetical protein